MGGTLMETEFINSCRTTAIFAIYPTIFAYDLGERVGSGIYFYQLQADNASHLRKMVILK